ncbi:DUF2075 domain-containing protein [Nocardia brasiliensis]|uniref:DUF2075 domain-containing protein n=1 Tax=Nocardia brasiliensis TaxID=37326 RepID=UPI0024576342|nr:DUF2075 domain-containing protein [Nocardia brasiliensis]
MLGASISAVDIWRGRCHEQRIRLCRINFEKAGKTVTLRPYRSTAAKIAAFPADEKKLKILPAEERLSALIAAHLAPRKAGIAERRSWDASLPLFARVLVDAGLSDIDMLIECKLPETDRRADVILAGIHPKTRKDIYVVVELKQWSHAALGWNSDQIVWSLYMRGDQLHPMDQVRGYCRYLRQYVEVLHDRPEAVHGVAYLHNATKISVSPLFERTPDQLGRLFTSDQRVEFISYLKGLLVPDAGVADRLLNSALRARKTLFQFGSAELQTLTHDSLLDNQSLAYEAVMNRITLSKMANNKTVVLVTGGPGSGKTQVAIAALLELCRRRASVQYATGSEAITKTMRRLLGTQLPELEGKLTYYRNLATAEPNALDVLICDEAHRIRRTSTNRFTPRGSRSARPQIDELMDAARVPVFLLDENQIVRPDEVGTADLIADHAARKGFAVFRINLEGQFRSGGSAAYDEWVRNLLGLGARWPTKWQGLDFDVRVASSPTEMERFLRTKNTDGVSARIAAGYCWPWSKPRSDGSLVDDVVIGDWAKPWNRNGDTLRGDSPPSWLWANDDRGFEQVGCVYTAQGFEYDWAGVILGPDLVLDGDRLAVCREANQDPKLQSKKLFDDDFEMLVRNTYKVLLTRAMQGVVIYAVDAATQKLLTDLIDCAPGQ